MKRKAHWLLLFKGDGQHPKFEGLEDTSGSEVLNGKDILLLDIPRVAEEGPVTVNNEQGGQK